MAKDPPNPKDEFGEKSDPAGFTAPGSGGADEGSIGNERGKARLKMSRRIYDYVVLGISDPGRHWNNLPFFSDNDPYVKIGGRGKNDHYGDPTLTDAQLKQAILRLVLTEDCHTLFCYNHQGNIDQQLTARAQNMLTKMQQPGRILDPRGETMEGRDPVRISQNRMSGVEPFFHNPLTIPFHAASKAITNYFEDRERTKDLKKGIKDDGKFSKGLTPPDPV